MRSLVFTATALFASVSLISARSQNTRRQIEDLTESFTINGDDNSNPLIVRPPSKFDPSSFNGNLPSFDGVSILASNALPFTSPQTIPKSNPLFSVTEVSRKTNFLPNDGSFNTAPQVDLKPPSTPSTTFNLDTKDLKKDVDKICSGQFTYGIFMVSKGLSSLAAIALSPDNDWDAFANVIRSLTPSYVLHPFKQEYKQGFLLIHITQNVDDNTRQQAFILDDNQAAFARFVEKSCQTTVDAVPAWDDSSLLSAINSHLPEDVPKIEFSTGNGV